MATSIQIKRSANAAPPSTSMLATSEIAYSQDRSNDGANAILYIESIDSDNNPVIHKIGGKYYTNLLDLATHLANANTIVKRDASGAIRTSFVIGNLYGNANLALNANFATLANSANIASSANSASIANSANAWTTARTITLTGDATGNAIIDGTSNITLEVTVTGGVGDGGNSNIAAYAVLAERSNSTTIANLSNIALFATNAGNANTSLVSNFATLAASANVTSQANNSINAEVAVFAQQASSATLSVLAQTSNFAILAESSNTSLLSGHSDTSNTALFATNATNSNVSLLSGFSSNAGNANISLIANFATLANSANIASQANNAINATIATYSTLAESANSAVIANNANNAINATTATNAVSASISDTANKWTTARNISVVGDAFGNVVFDGSANATLTLDVAFADLSGQSNTATYSTLAESANSAIIANNANNAINATTATNATWANNSINANAAIYSTLAEKSNSSVISNTANALTNPITINVIGDAAGSVTFDGSANANLNIAITNVTNSVSVADTANKWTTARNITVLGNATGNVMLDGSANVSLTLDVNQANNANTALTSNFATLAESANSAVIANNANNAINATTATNATFATLANSSNIATQANNAINATVATYSTLAESANSAIIANNANNSINATVSVFATLAESANITSQANNAINATVATFATLANSANIASQANNAINATTATNAIHANSATISDSANITDLANISIFANNSGNANIAIYTILAESANITSQANNAINATVAVFAENCNTSVFAETANASAFTSEATHAVLADLAEVAESALFADVATSATIADSSNNSINATVSTYATLAESSNIAVIANAWTTARTITLTGDATGNAIIDGSQNVNINTTVDYANSLITLGQNTTGDYVSNVLGTSDITVTGQGGEGANVTVSLNNTAVSANTYGGQTQIPTFAVDGKGRITEASNVNIVTDVLIGGNSGTDTVTTGEVLRVIGVDRISTSVASNTITVVNNGVVKVDGTENQIQVSANVGNIILSLPNNVTAPGDVTVLGQLNVVGNITTTNFISITAEDSLFKLANNNSSSDAIDIGFYGQYNNGGIKYAGMIRDASDGIFKIFKDTTSEPSNVTNFSNVSIATISANLTGGNISSLFKAITVTDGGTGNNTFKANSVIVGNGVNALDSVTGSEGQVLKIVSGKPAFANETTGGSGTLPTNVEFILATANATVVNGKVLSAGNNITLERTVANTIIIKREAFTGDVTSPSNSNVLTIASNVITNAKMIVMPPRSFKVNMLATSNTPQDFQVTGTGKVLGVDMAGNINLISFSSVFTMSGNTLTLTNGSILNGTVDPTTEGSDNDLYYNKTNVTLHGPKSSGTWPADAINLKTKPGWNYVFGPSTGNNDPGVEKIRFDTANVYTLTTMRINVTDDDGVNRTDFINAIVTNGTVDILSAALNGTTNIKLRVTGNLVAPSSTYFNIPVSRIAGTALPGDQEKIVIHYTPGPNILWDDTLKVLRDATSGNEISNPLTYESTNHIPLLANAFTNKAAVIKNNGFPYAVYSDGNVINTIGVERLHSYNPSTVRKFILPNSGLTWTISNNAGKVRLTTTGAVPHGLTSANAVVAANIAPVTIKVASGSGWTANSFHEISAVGANTIDLNTNHTGQGAPVVVAANTEVDMLEITLPVLTETSTVRIKFGIGSSGGTTSRRTKVYLDNALLTEQNKTSTNKYDPYESGFCNLNQTNLQRGLHGFNSTGFGGSTIEPTTTNIETKNGNTVLKISALLASSDVMHELQNYFLYITGK